MRRREGGFVAIEWVAAVVLLLIPAVVLVGSLPTWAERRHAATVAAREAARDLQQHWPAGSVDEATLVAKHVAADHGVASSDVAGRVLEGGINPGDQIRVEVEVVMPAIALPGARRIAGWNYSA